MAKALHLFGGYGIELEYMIVHEDTREVFPVADELLKDRRGRYTNELTWGGMAWSNELVAHLIELKGARPFPALETVWQPFQEQVDTLNSRLKDLGARLLPGAVHPWMDPARDARLWPHGYTEIYSAFDRIFGCRSHGWTNLQSMHINLPFYNDEEFGRLHAAIRLLLPIMPALAASSPILDGAVTGFMDSRLEVYRANAQKIPSIAGYVIPEPIFSIKAYKQQILKQLYNDIAPHDPQRILRYEWVNARGAIARFERNTIEIRVLDVQECPMADLAIAWAVTHTLKALVAERWTPYAAQQAWAVEPLRDILLRVIRDAEQTAITDVDYMRMFGVKPSEMTAGALWQDMIEQVVPPHPVYTEALRVMIDEGPLARRILRRTGARPARADLDELLVAMMDALANGEMVRA
ncbi:MAG: glutamate--cysteine ligase [Spartobacteria bacterium]|nr:glutamate--cysteine ligase [Spartobacteria bacterium]